MKPSSLYSSPSSGNAHETLPTSAASAAGCCMSRILRRILCFSSLPSPYHCHVGEGQEKESLLVGASAAPGLVAGLMGLESVPVKESPFMHSVDSLRKSRSTHGIRRRQIIPSYQQLEEDDKFFILSFESHAGRRKAGEESDGENCDKKRTRRRRRRRIRKNLEETNKENEGARISRRKDLDSDKNPSNVLRPLKKYCQIPGNTRKKKVNEYGLQAAAAPAITFETQDESENSSPNSVLELVEFPADRETACSGDVSRLASSKMRRTLSEELENCGKSKEERAKNNGFGEEERVISRLRHQNDAVKWEELGKLAAEDMVKSRWVEDEILKNKHSLKEIGRDVASQILDHLLDEMIIYLENF